MNKLIPVLMFAVFGASAAAQQPPIPTNLTYRPATFARPSRAILRFNYGSDYFPSSTFHSHSTSDYRAHSTGPHYYSSSLSSAAASRSSYYDSVIGNYGANPYSGLDASLRLYSTPRPESADSYGADYTDPYYFLNRTYSHRDHRSGYGY